MSDLIVFGIFLACFLSTVALIWACGCLMPVSTPRSSMVHPKGDRT